MRNAALILAALLLGSCHTPDLRSAFTLRVALVGPLDELTGDPARSLSGLAQEWVFEPLIRISEDGTLAPALAQKLERRGASVHFVVRDGATFSDGAPVVASDVIESLARHQLIGKQDGDGITIDPPLGGGSIDALLPLVVVGSHRPGAGWLGSGPFRVVEQNPRKIALERIHRASRRINRIELLGFATPREAIARTLAGDADLLPRVEPRLAEFFDGVARLRILRGRSTQAASIAFSMSLPLQERRGLAALLSDEEIGRSAFGRECQPWPRFNGMHPRLGPGPRLDVVSPSLDIGYERLGLAVRRALGARGGEVRVVTVQQAIRAWAAGSVRLLATPVLVWPLSVAGATFRSNSTENIWHYSDRRVDQALDAGNWEDAQHAIEENPPLVHICLQEKLVAVDSRIKAPRLGAVASLEFVPEWEVE